MERNILAFLLGTLLSTAGGTTVDGYAKTEGAWIVSLHQRNYSVDTAAECAAKCNEETSFMCKSFTYIEKDQECWTAASNSKTENIRHRLRAALYEKEEFLLECVNGTGTNYRGTKSRTKSGKTCQRWDAQLPHSPTMTPQSHPRADLESNFCRNPDSNSGGPWCYTTDPDTRWEHCNVASCDEECIECSGEDYRGKISTTENGFTCQRWDAQKPHNHGFDPSAHPEKYLEENYCRNPDGSPRLWCFTTSPSKLFDYCDIPRCTSEPPTIIPETTCATGEGSLYRGTIAVTESGKTCQSWSAQTPHRHNRTPQNYPCKGMDNNYCRNPDNERRPWCFTTDPNSRWEYCAVPSCADGAQPDEAVVPPEEEDCYEGNGTSYRGIASETISGKRCQNWNSKTPHRHQITHGKHPNADLRRNLCRNPDGDRAPWCFTMDPRVRWEYCNLEQCSSSPEPTPAEPQPQATATQAPPQRDCKVGSGATYRGPTSVTINGVRCQAWSAQSPHRHNTFTPETHPTHGLEGNSCRNPDSDVNGPWCYTTDRNWKWEYCRIPDCARTCGVPVVKPKRCFGRISGSCLSRPHSWPWMISLRNSTGNHFCGGTLIHPEWVLTAARCLDSSTTPSAYKVLLGVHTERANEPSKQERNLEKVVLGPGGADIALLKLESPALINDKVLPVCLPEKDFIVPNEQTCYVSGWGESQGVGGAMKEDAVPVMENKACNSLCFLNGKVKGHEMCAGNIQGGIAECPGDSGGPLVCFSQFRFFLQGVTMWGRSCVSPMKPAVYTRVSKFVEWINQTMTAN